MISMQKYFSSEIVKRGINSSGWCQEKMIRPLKERISDLVKEKDLDDFFKAVSLEEQKELFQKFSAELEEAVLLVVILLLTFPQS